MYIRRFTYTKEDVDSKLCTEYWGGKNVRTRSARISQNALKPEP